MEKKGEGETYVDYNLKGRVGKQNTRADGLEGSMGGFSS